MKGSPSFPFTSLIILFLSLFSLSLIIDASKDDDKPFKYLVFISRPQNVDPVKFDIDLLYSVLHSKEAAEKAIIYHYLELGGFGASLTKKQANELAKNPSVLTIIPDRIYHLVGPDVDNRN